MASDLNRLLNEERQQLETELEEIRSQISRAESRLSQVIQRLRHVRALLGEDEPNESDDRTDGLTVGPNHNGTSETVSDIAADILSERHGQPMYYKELATEVMNRGGTLGGNTPWATLVSRITQDSRFVRPTSKGYYALRSDYPNARNVGAKTQSRRRQSNL